MFAEGNLHWGIYVQIIFQPMFLLYIQQGGDVLSQQDNARQHAARDAQKGFLKHVVQFNKYGVTSNLFKSPLTNLCGVYELITG